MPQYKKYLSVKDQPSRKLRKSTRHSTFQFNKSAGAVERKARREARRANGN